MMLDPRPWHDDVDLYRPCDDASLSLTSALVGATYRRRCVEAALACEPRASADSLASRSKCFLDFVAGASWREAAMRAIEIGVAPQGVCSIDEDELIRRIAVIYLFIADATASADERR